MTSKLTRLLWLVLLASLPFGAALLGQASATETLWSPYPVVTFNTLTAEIPMLWMAAAASLLFIVTNLDTALADDVKGIPRRWPTVMGLLTALTCGYFAMFSTVGARFQGVQHTVAVLLLNATIITICWILWFRWRREGGTLHTLSLSAIVHVWIFWCAFPYFGEGP